MNKKYLFIHVPKTAGLAVRVGLQKVNPDHNFLYPFSNEERHPHFTVARYVREQYPIDDLFKFCFIRNPIDRFASAFFYLSSGALPPAHDKVCAHLQNSYENINDFVLNFDREEDFIKNKPHFQPQSRFIYDKGKLGVDFVGTVENLQEDFILVLKKLGVDVNKDYAVRETRSWGPIKVPVTLPHENVTLGRKTYVDLFTPESIAILSCLYARDFKLHEKALLNRTQLS